jgi:hypothetical protein
MNVPSSLAIVAFAALIHASFQLSVSVLVILSSHTIGARHSQAKLLRLTTSFVIGAGVMTILLLSFVSLVVLSLLGAKISPLAWAIACGMLVGIAISIWMFYYRREKGTTLWIPRGMAEYLTERTKSTKLSAEAFGLGLSSVFGELLFIIAPLTVAALALVQLPSIWQLTGIAIYAFISLLSLLIVWVLISSGHKLSSIQKWRESNKYFLQFTAGSGLIILSVFVYTSQVLGNIVGGV